MPLWHSMQQMLEKCHTTSAVKSANIQEVHQSWGSADIHRYNSNSLKVYNIDRQLSIMQNLSATTTADTAVQNPSISELYMVQTKHSKKGPATDDRSQDMCQSCYCCGTTSSYPKKYVTYAREWNPANKRTLSSHVTYQVAMGEGWDWHLPIWVSWLLTGSRPFQQFPTDHSDEQPNGNPCNKHLAETCSKLVISVTEHLVEVVDKLSTTAVVLFRSARILKCKCLYGPKMLTEHAQMHAGKCERW